MTFAMKFAAALVVFAAAPAVYGAAIFTANSEQHLHSFGAAVSTSIEDRPITKVVKLLQSMLDKSKADGDAERVLYAKFKCYCDTNKAEKEDEIATLTENIALLENEIAKLQAETAVLSKEVAKLKADMEKNKADQGDADALRTKENTEFLALKADLEGAIDQIKRAIQTLSDIGADQTLGAAAADHDKFMAGYTEGNAPATPTFLLKVGSLVKQALTLSSTKVTLKQAAHFEAFLQAPFTGTYTSQSAEVVGILKDMEDTFQSNLDAAIDTEAKAVEAHTKYMAAMQEAWDAMKKSYDEKQGTLSANDGALGTKRKLLQTAESEKADAEEFLEKLLEMCSNKAKEYDSRNMLRANEEAALAEAISILNSDAAFETFGKVSATSVPTFVQVGAIKKHKHSQPIDEVGQRQKVMTYLRGKNTVKSSGRIARILTLIAAHNPFTVVLEEIQKMIDLIDDEESVDDQKHAWCIQERKDNNAELSQKITQITTLEGQIATLEDTIDNPQTGLKALIKNTEASLLANSESQTSETAERREDNLEYQKNIEHLQEADALLVKALSVLNKYYAKILAGSFVAVSKKKEDPAPPSTWDAEYKGQSTDASNSGKTGAIDMVQYILDSTRKEETERHQAENDAQHAYEDSMTQLKTDEASMLKQLASNRLALTEAEEELIRKEEDKKATIADKEAIEAYLLKIKPGCDFMDANIAQRKANRKTEKGALLGAIDFLKASPAYLTAEAESHNETLGDCLETCTGREDHVECKACLAKVTVPGYCAGHPGTTGC